MLPKIWSEMPQSLIVSGNTQGWLKVKSRCIKLIRSKHGYVASAAAKVKVESKLSIHAEPFVPENTDMDLYLQFMRTKNDGILII